MESQFDTLEAAQDAAIESAAAIKAEKQADFVEKKPRVKKPKPEIRLRRRRPRKEMIVSSKKFIREEHDYFIIQFPEELTEKYREQLADIKAFQGPYGNRIPYDPTGTIPVEQLTYLSVWKVRVSEESLQAVAKFGKSNRFDFDSDIAVRAQLSSTEGRELEKMSYAESCKDLPMPKFPFKKDVTTGKPFAFKPFQKAGIAYALRAKRTFIADEMGLGKTVEGFGTIVCDLENLTRDGLKQPWLVITPANLRINWYKTIKAWLPNKITVAMIKNKYMHTREVKSKKTGEMRVVNTIQTKKFLAEHQIFVMPYDKIHRFGPQLEKIQWRGMICDESHYLKGRNSKRSKAFRAFAKEIDPQHILLLSGTPLMNRPYDLLPQLQVLDRLNDFGGYNNFLTRYCTLSTTNVEHVSKVHKALKEGVIEQASEANDNTETIDLTKLNKSAKAELDEAMRDAMVRKLYENMIALNKSLRSICFVRREKDDVLKDLPAKTRQTIALEITNRKEYERIEADVLGYLAEQAVQKEKFKAQIKKLSKDAKAAAIASAKAAKYEMAARAEALVKIQALKVCAAVVRMKGVKEWIDNFLESGEKLVVFATHTIILNELKAMYPDALEIRSNMSVERRQENVEEFQTNKKAKLIIIGLKLATGMTLTASRATVTIEFGWTPSVHDQAEDRVHRITQKRAVTAYYLVAARTIDERIGKLIEEKRRVVNSVADGDPLKGAESGNVLGDLLTELTGRMRL